MCIKEVPGFQYAGTIYPTKQAAITAALTKIGESLLKSSPGAIVADIMAHGVDLMELIPAHMIAFPQEQASKPLERTREPVTDEPICPIGTAELS